MSRRLPERKKDNRVLIICEGNEEYEYLAKLKACGVWSQNFSIELKNAKSIDNISSVYQYEYQNSSYLLILIFCDTEEDPYDKFLLLNKKINEFHGKKCSESVIFFSNPCTMQIILSHFSSKVRLTANSKSVNSTLIEKLTGVTGGYRATDKQLSSIMKKIDECNYKSMKNNISKLSTLPTSVPSTNSLELFENLDLGDRRWANRINQRIK